MVDIINTDDEENEDNDENEGTDNVVFTEPSVVFRRPGKSKGDKVHKNDTPVENAEDIPLFSDADKRGLRSVTYLNIVKLDAPKSGYKGQIPINSTLTTIAELYGDGLYNIEACNSRHQVLRTKENVRISMGTSNGESKGSTIVKTGPDRDTILETMRELRKQHDSDMDRLAKELSRSAHESKSNSDQFVKLVQTTTESAMARDREHYASVNKSQQDFFANIMASSQQGFQQMMVLMQMGHQHLIEALKHTYEGGSKTSDVDTLLKGIMVAKSFNDGNEEPDWLRALSKGGSMLTSLVALKQNTNPTITPPPESDDEEPENKPEEKPKKQGRKIPISQEELAEILRLKKVLNGRGIDMGEMLRQAREHYIDDDSKLNASQESTDEPKENQSE